MVQASFLCKILRVNYLKRRWDKMDKNEMGTLLNTNKKGRYVRQFLDSC
jgi:hypothetical protein